MSEGDKVVSVVRCEEYGRERTYQAVKRSVKLLGGLERFTAPGRKVFVKFNLLLGAAPEKCITTHPDVVYAIARLLKEYGCQVVLGDSPGSGLPYTEEVLRKSYAGAGYDKVSEELNVPLNYDTGFEWLTGPGGKSGRGVAIITPAVEADDIVVVSKAKTHALTIMSGAAKNIFGLVPGLEKPTYHASFQSADEFSRVMLDLNELMRPKLQIMDAVMAMEGDGPHNGTPRKIGAVLASGDWNAVDAVTTRLMSFDPLDVSTIRAAVERGSLKKNLSDITTVGDPWEDLVVPGFKLPPTHDDSRIGSIVKAIVPRILLDRCIGCMRCLRACPVKAITPVEGKPSIDYDKCIRCYCCHEMCDEHAIMLDKM